MRSTARSAGSSTEPPWIFRLERSCLGRFQGSVSPGAGDPVPDFWLRSSSSERSAEDDMEQRDVMPAGDGRQRHLRFGIQDGRYHGRPLKTQPDVGPGTVFGF
ncbi:hypothetical protein CIB84_014953 [Bambusicola thoracicus]|uniref:Uncharacterized protein n=2 Tax=Bambusicola thoracicus TaxID=9083 RepID=A0A2P4SB25_BAMTH|nr:hypothetical protein CIB84_014953 [Bambusicola thoracicus]